MMQQASIEKIIIRQRQFFATGKTKTLSFRLKALDRLEHTIIQYEDQIYEALNLDLNKSRTESYMTEVGMALDDLSYIKKRLKRWTKRNYVMSPLAQFPSESFTCYEPYGVTLVMSPWNYPFLLCIGPLIGAIAAGNCCVLKPSNYSPNTSAVIAKMIKEAFPEQYVTTIQGGRDANKELLDQRFDYIFFTGGVTVGRLVMEKAAKHLTPVTLELGGKSPCIIDESANIRLAAKRIVFGKYLNAGQTCVAPDYVLIHESKKEEFLRYAQYYIHKFFGEDVLKNPSYPKIINEKHFNRILGLISDEKIVIGGKGDKQSLKIEPTILDHITADSKIMQEEIFGPVLPVLTFELLTEAELFVLQREKPLACYLFTTNKKTEHRLLNRLSFGGCCVNDTIVHLATSRMSFGGVGYSGMGSYHGKESFLTFSHKKGILKKSNRIDLPIRYQPYTKLKDKLIRMFLG